MKCNEIVEYQSPETLDSAICIEVMSWFEEGISVVMNMNRNVEQNIGLRPRSF